MTNEATTLALIAILGTVVTGLFKLLSNNTKALDKMSHSMGEVAKSNKRIADESKQRNGHLGELIVKQGVIAMQNKEQIVDNIKGLTINKQTVHQQTVEHEIVKNKE